MLGLYSGVAAAHGRPPSLNQLHFRGDVILAQGTFGLVRSDDGGQSFYTYCAAAYGVDARNLDPRILLGPNDRALVGTYDGLLQRNECSFSFPEPALEDQFVIDLVALDEDVTRLLALRTDGSKPDQLFRSDDGGQSFEPLGPAIEDVLLERVLTANGGTRIYLSGARPQRPDQSRAAFLFRSDDSGATFERFSFPLLEGERNLIILGAEGDTVFGQVLHFNGEFTPERLVVSRDGGETFTDVGGLVDIGGFAATSVGTLVGSRRGGLYRIDDGLERLSDIAVRCIGEHRGEVFVCADQTVDGFALARSADGVAFEPMLRLEEIGIVPPCPDCSDVAITCEAWAPDLVYDLGIDAPLPPDFDPQGDVGAPREVPLPVRCGGEGPSPGIAGGGCALARTRTRTVPTMLLLLILLALRRRGGVASRRTGGLQ
ncbi:MAG: hypothetical protein AAGF12_29815 [Myxococcota bacterium]